jgi:subtilisin family serine protease
MATTKSQGATKRRGSRKASGPSERRRGGTKLPQSDPRKKPFTPESLDKTVIAIPLLDILNEEKARIRKNRRLKPEIHPVIIDLNLEFPGGREAAREWVIKATKAIIGPAVKKGDAKGQGINITKSEYSEQYLFARLEGRVIRELVRRDREEEKPEHANLTVGAGVGPRAIYHIWPDFKVRPLINKSISTVKADAARAAFSAFGHDVVWAVIDSGVEGDHPHFKLHNNLDLRRPLTHEDFTGDEQPLVDAFGHGTHVAGIIAGEMSASNSEGDEKQGIVAYARQRDENGEITYRRQPMTSISGMAPKCKILSLKVLNDDGEGETSSLIAAIAKIQKINGHGRRLLIHGVNMSLGYQFEPEWFACGQSPLCVEVDRLVRSGVIVCVAAGNSGYGRVQTEFYGKQPAGLEMTIDDPGNAELAITVGATHRDMPHVYGVSYFSSKGPTGDGRIKPDIVAPGEKILSCAAGNARKDIKAEIRKQVRQQGKKIDRKDIIDCDYLEESGTSMATPHVSGVIAAFLSVRREFIGQPERVKQIFLSTATDLKRERYFQGSGLIDLMRAIQSV